MEVPKNRLSSKLGSISTQYADTLILPLPINSLPLNKKIKCSVHLSNSKQGVLNEEPVSKYNTYKSSDFDSDTALKVKLSDSLCSCDRKSNKYAEFYKNIVEKSITSEEERRGESEELRNFVAS